MNQLFRLTPRNFLIAAHDALVTALAVVLSFYLRFGDSFSERLPTVIAILPYIITLSIVVCYTFNLTMTKWRFISLHDFLNIVKAATVLGVALLVIDYVFVAPNVYGAFFFGKTTIIIYWILQIALLSGPRLLYRYYRLSRTRNRTRSLQAAPSVLVGAAADVELLIRSIESGVLQKIWPACILSPSRADQGQIVRGVPVLGGIEDFEAVVKQIGDSGKPIEKIIMTPSALATDSRPEHLIRQARRMGLNVSRMPWLEDGHDTTRLTPVAIEDLLLRPAVKIDYTRLEELIKNKAIVVTGGGGSIGSEICNRVIAFGATRLLVIEHSEPALYSIMETLTGAQKDTTISGRIADIRDRNRMFSLLEEFKPEIVFHAAALKHVPVLERDYDEGVKTNIFGTINVADAALSAGAKAMVMISTDKAIEPVSMLGLTKRFAEMYCQALDQDIAAAATPCKLPMRFISVRFGNVLASNGSVIPKFKAQIEAGGPVTVTHPDMVRFFMTIREACDLVITSASHALRTGSRDVSVYVLKMGQPVRISDLADRLIRLSGLIPGEDIQVVFSGIRPGERLHEILFANEEPATEIGIDGVMAAKPNQPPLSELRKWISALEDASQRQDQKDIRTILTSAVPEFRINRNAAE
jgi:O-antigen biosynthesis protein WbqV